MRPSFRGGSWRQGLITFAGVMPLSLVLNAFLAPVLSRSIPQPLVIVVNAALLVVVLNWAFLPLAQYLTRGWASRRPDPESTSAEAPSGKPHAPDSPLNAPSP